MIDKIKLLKNGTLKKISGTEYFEVDKPFMFNIYEKNKLIGYIEVPTGFITNFGSIPSILFFFDKTRYISYIFHDYLYSLIGEVYINGYKRHLTRYESDYLLNIGLDNEGMVKSGIFSVYLGVRIGGIFHYHKKDSNISQLKYNRIKYGKKRN